jgi:hypothetical protein
MPKIDLSVKEEKEDEKKNFIIKNKTKISNIIPQF